MNAVETVQAFTAEKLEGERFRRVIADSFNTAIKRIRVRALFTTIAATGVFGALIFVLWMGAKAVLSGEITSGELGQFVLYAVFVGVSAAALSEIWGEVQRASGAMERLTELLLMKPAIVAPENPIFLPRASERSVRFEQVSFSYPSRPDVQAISHLNLRISAGEHVAVVGPSGAGKSTIFQLLLRFYNTASGRILIDDTDISLMAPEDVRRYVGIVPQETTIFGASAADNIRFGRPDATDEDVIEAAQAALAHDFIAKLPEGYDTFLGEKGARLSGGQKQRIAIARAVLKDPPILLLDEATSALDAESERLVQQALEKLQENRTPMVIAHRLATVLDADRIVVMNEGKIDNIGSHSTLIDCDPLYASMVKLQFGEAVLEQTR